MHIKKKCLPLPWSEQLSDLESPEIESLDPMFLNPEFLKSDPPKPEPLEKKRIAFPCILQRQEKASIQGAICDEGRCPLTGLGHCNFINPSLDVNPLFGFII